MAINKIINYTLNKLFFPKVIVIDRPGIIISKTSSKYSNKESKKRTVCCFEDILVNLQLETIKKLGKNKTSKMYYKLGKEIGTAYMLLARMKKLPSFLIRPIVEYIFRNLEWVGLSYDTLKYNHKEKSFVFKGKQVPISRKTKDHSTFVGMFSAILSFLIGKNIEGEVKYIDNSDDCLYVFNEKIEKKFIPDIDKLKPIKNYDKLNFPTKIIFREDMSSFSELIKFKKIKLEEQGKLYFMGKLILPTTTEFLNIVAIHYLEINEKKILEKGVINGAERLASDILKYHKTKQDKIKAIKNMLCAFGWGIPHLRKVDNNLVFDIIHPPISKYGFLYQALVINGYLNYIFNAKLKIEDIKRTASPLKISIHYCFNTT